MARSRRAPAQERAARSQRAIVEALIELIDATDKCPTALDVATRAGVSVRLVYHHFGDMEGVYEAAAGWTADRYWRSAPVVPAHLPLAVRIDLVIRKRAAIYEHIGRLRRAVARVLPQRPALAEAVANRNELLRSWLVVTFEPELLAAEERRTELLSAMDLVTSWEAWDQLRRAQGRTTDEASRAMATCLESLLGRRGERSCP